MSTDISENQDGYYSEFISPNIAHLYIDSFVKDASIIPNLISGITVYGEVGSPEMGRALYSKIISKALELASFGEWLPALQLVEKTTNQKAFMLNGALLKTDSVRIYRNEGIGKDFARNFESRNDEMLSQNLHSLIYEYVKGAAISWALTGDRRYPEPQKNIAAIQKNRGEFNRFDELLVNYGIEKENFVEFIDNMCNLSRRQSPQSKAA